MCFRTPFLPPFFPHFSPLFPLQALSILAPLLPSSPPPSSPLFWLPEKSDLGTPLIYVLFSVLQKISGNWTDISHLRLIRGSREGFERGWGGVKPTSCNWISLRRGPEASSHEKFQAAPSKKTPLLLRRCCVEFFMTYPLLLTSDSLLISEPGDFGLYQETVSSSAFWAKKHPLARNQYINNSQGLFSCIRAGANTGATCICTEMNSPKNLAKYSKILIPQKNFPVFARARIQAPHAFAQKVEFPQTFSCMCWFRAGG